MTDKDKFEEYLLVKQQMMEQINELGERITTIQKELFETSVKVEELGKLIIEQQHLFHRLEEINKLINQLF